jgi:hypothetical protein
MDRSGYRQQYENRTAELGAEDDNGIVELLETLAEYQGVLPAELLRRVQVKVCSWAGDPSQAAELLCALGVHPEQLREALREASFGELESV